jgi:hypothetical protein
MTDGGTPDLAHACELVGRFFYFFSRVELELNNAVIKLFKLDPESGPIITANIDFIKKLYIVRAAVNYQQETGEPKGRLTVDTAKTFKDITVMNDKRQVVAHCAFEPECSGGVQFKRTIAKKELKRDDPHWTKEEFEDRFKTLQRLEGELKQIINELKPDRIQWPSAAFAAYLFAPHSDPDWRRTFSNKS